MIRSPYNSLKLEFETFNSNLDFGVPKAIFRYFNNEEDRDNFLKGNIWFFGPNKHRFFSTSGNDPFENRNNFGSFIYDYGLSFSTEIINETKPNIKISNPVGFV